MSNFNSIESLLDLGRAFHEEMQLSVNIKRSKDDPSGRALTPLAILFLDRKIGECEQFDSVVCGSVDMVIPEKIKTLFDINDDKEHVVISAIALNNNKTLNSINLVVVIENTLVLFQPRDDDSAKFGKDITEKFFKKDGVSILETEVATGSVWEDYMNTLSLVQQISEWNHTPIKACANCPLQRTVIKGIE